MLDILLRLSIGFGAGGLAVKLAADRAAQKIPGLECYVLVPRQNVGDYLKGSSGVWTRGDRKKAVNELARNSKFVKFADDGGYRTIRIYPPLSLADGQQRVPSNSREGDLNVFIFSTPEKSTSIEIPSVDASGTFSGPALRPTGGKVYYDVFGHPLAQWEDKPHSVYFLGLLHSDITASSLGPLVRALNGDNRALEAGFISLDCLSANNFPQARGPEQERLLWTNGLKQWITSEAKQVKDVKSVEFPGPWRFSVFTDMITYKGRNLGAFMITFSFNSEKSRIVTWFNRSYPPRSHTGYGRPFGHAPMVDENGISRLHIALVDIPMALAEYRIKEAVRLSIRVLKSSLDTQKFNLALASYPPAQ